MKATINGREIAWEETGSGRTILFLHGFPFNRQLWYQQMQAVPEGWRGVAMDLRGFGESAGSDDPAYTMELHADDVAALLTHLRVRRAVICGLSMGGYVALALWAGEGVGVPGVHQQRSHPLGGEPHFGVAHAGRPRQVGGEAAVTRAVAAANVSEAGFPSEGHARIHSCGERRLARAGGTPPRRWQRVSGVAHASSGGGRSWEPCGRGSTRSRPHR